MHLPRPPPTDNKHLIELKTLGLKGVFWSSAYATREKIIYVVLAAPAFDNMLICARHFGPHRIRALMNEKPRFLQTRAGQIADRILRNIESGFELAAERAADVERARNSSYKEDSSSNLSRRSRSENSVAG